MLDHRLIFIRHGETDWNNQGRLQGQRDVPIDPRGRDQAAAAGRLLKHWLGGEAATALAGTDFVASPLLRTRQTMELVRVNLGLPPRPYRLDERLMELSFGTWEGLTWREIKSRDPRGLLARRADKWGFVPPHGESYAMLAVRVAAWLRTLAGATLAVSHGGVARVLMQLVAGVPTDAACEAEIDQGRVLIFQGNAYAWI